MGYTTEFTGEFKLDRQLEPQHLAYLKAFNRTRRMKRDEKKVEKLPDEVRLNAGLPIGEQGGYYVGSTGHRGQDFGNTSILDHNAPPAEQPGLWCQWEPGEDGQSIRWDEGEKFYDYVEWLEYIIEHFLAPWDYKLNGSVSWQGEDDTDIGVIKVTDNTVHAAPYSR